MKSLLGDFIGINLEKYNHLALDPKNPNPFYAMRFENIKCPDVVLKHFLENARGSREYKAVSEEE